MRILGIAVPAIFVMGFLWAHAAQAAAQQVTANGGNETWSVRNSSTSQGKLLWSDGNDVFFSNDGSNVSTVQSLGALTPVGVNVFALGTGAAPGEVIGVWRRDTDFAWIWTRTAGDVTTLTDLKYTHPIAPGTAMNPEAVAVADGCVFMALQFTGGKAHVYRVDPLSGVATNLTGNANVAGATSAKLTTSGCKAAWAFDDGSGTIKLQFYDGSVVTQVDAGTLTNPHLSQGRIVYEKTVSGIAQIFLYDTTLPSPSPVQLSTDSSGQNRFARTDGRHVAWVHTEANGTTHNVILNGGIDLTADASTRPQIPFAFENEFQLQRGQLLWRDAGGTGRYHAAGRLAAIDALPATSFEKFWLADGVIAWLGTSNDGGADIEAFRLAATVPADALQPAAPMVVQATAGTQQATVSWDRILGASSYNVYMALQPGVTKDNYLTLSGGIRFAGVSSPFTVTGLSERGSYHFVVTTVEGATEGPSSPEAQASLTGNLAWIPASGLPAGNIYAVAGDRGNVATAYAAPGTGVYKSSDSGSTWTGLAGGIEALNIRALAADGPTVHAATRQGDILRSVNGGISWTVVADGLDIGEQNKSLIIDPLTPTTLYAGNFELPSKQIGDSYVVKSVDGGATWSHVKEAAVPGAEIRAYALAVDPIDGNLYAGGTGTPNLARSADGGTNWTAISPATGFVFAATADSRQATSLYAGMMNISQNASLGIRKSTKEGAAGSWIAKNAGLPGTLPRINFLLADARNPAYLHAATEAGYFFSVDAAENWSGANTNLTDTYINALALTGSRRLLAATSSGVFVMDLSAPSTSRTRADFNGDGRSDILWRNPTTFQNYLFFMDGVNLLPASGFIPGVGSPWVVAGMGDFNGDGKSDILWRNDSTGQNYVFFMDGVTTLPASGFVPGVGSPWVVASIGDFNGDGKSDILWRNETTGQNYVFFMDGVNLLPSSGFIAGVGSPWVVIGTGDFNGDGKSDILWRNPATFQNYVFFMDGVNLLPSSGFIAGVGSPWVVAGLADFNGDGKSDILWRNASTGQNYVFFLDGVNLLPATGFIAGVGAPWTIEATGDYNGDGNSDILWRNATTGQNYVFFMDGTTLLPATGFTAGVGTPWVVIGE